MDQALIDIIFEEGETNDIIFGFIAADEDCCAESGMRLTVKRNANK